MSEHFAFVSFPTAPLNEYLVKLALEKSTACANIRVVSSISSLPPADSSTRLLQWASYDEIDHSRTLEHVNTTLASSYIIRKVLIRKNFLSRAIQAFTRKNQTSLLSVAYPRSWDIDIAFADELDELLTDELYELNDAFESEPSKWWVLKPAMTDQGNGLRLFNTRADLEEILQEFEIEENSDEEDSGGAFLTQMRSFVIQEYLEDPVLFHLEEKSGSLALTDFHGHKFHLRVYCVASRALNVHFYTRILALFAPKPWQSPERGEDDMVDLTAHLTNTSLHDSEDQGVSFVRLLDELVGYTVLRKHTDSTSQTVLFTNDDITGIMDQIQQVLCETFEAAIANPVYFLPLPNAFELFGVDFLVTHDPRDSRTCPYKVSLLEFNAEPAIEKTGKRLQWILEDLFSDIAATCVSPFVSDVGEPSEDEDTREHLRLCFHRQLR